MAKRQKKTIISGVTREAAEEAFAQYAKADASVNKINAEIELQCAKIREKYQSQLVKLTGERETAFQTLEAFASENKAELFTKKKSLDMAHGTIGFRTGMPKLKTVKGFTWASALTLVKKLLPADYVRRTEELDKERLLSDRELNEVRVCDVPGGEIRKVPMREAMASVGIYVVQEETFYVEPKKEENS